MTSEHNIINFGSNPNPRGEDWDSLKIIKKTLFFPRRPKLSHHLRNTYFLGVWDKEYTLYFKK